MRIPSFFGAVLLLCVFGHGVFAFDNDKVIRFYTVHDSPFEGGQSMRQAADKSEIYVAHDAQFVVSSLEGTSIEGGGTSHLLNEKQEEIKSWKTPWSVGVFFKATDANQFQTFMKANIGKRIAIVFAGRILSVAVVQEWAYRDSLLISTGSLEETQQIKALLDVLVPNNK